MARILLAEDDNSMMQFLQVALRRAGHEVTARNDGLEALEALGGDTKYDLLLTDIVMPGMDGVELARKATKICPEMQVMFITGFAATTLGKQASSVDNARLLSKPFHLNELVSQIEKVLEAA